MDAEQATLVVVQGLEAFRLREDELQWQRADTILMFRNATKVLTTNLKGKHIRGWKNLSEMCGYSPRHLLSLCRTAEIFPPGKRIVGDHYITFGHHRIAGTFGLEDPYYWLQKAVDENWSINTLKAEIYRSHGLGVGDKECPDKRKQDWCGRFQKVVLPEECIGCEYCKKGTDDAVD
jgi:hypothetical protein